MCGGVLRWRLIAFLVLFWTAAANVGSTVPAAADQSPDPAIKEIRHVSVPGYTRVIVTLSARADYEHFQLAAAHDQPSRIVVDFSPARIEATAQAPTPVRDGLLENIRTGQFAADTARVVLDLERAGSYTAFPLYSPYRLIVDVQATAGRVRKAQGTPTPRPEPAVQPARPVAAEPKYRVMIDPGHGGRDPGAIGVGGLEEKTVVLDVSRTLGRKLEARLPVEVLFTRTADVFVPLPERTARANAANVDLFLSIHANASENAHAQGVETYYLNNTNDRATIRLARMENGLGPMQAVLHEDPTLSLLLSDMVQNQKVDGSIALANAIQTSIIPQVSRRHRQVRNLGVKKGPFYVLVGAHMPCVLVEVSFLTHRVQGRLLRSAEYREAIAEGIFQGVAHFIRQERQGLGPL